MAQAGDLPLSFLCFVLLSFTDWRTPTVPPTPLTFCLNPAEQVFPPINPQLGDVNVRLSPALEAKVAAGIDRAAGTFELIGYAVLGVSGCAAVRLLRRP